MADPVVIGFGANKWVKDSNTKMKCLYFQNFSSSGTFTLHDAEDGSNYQVPVGKKLIVLSILYVCDTGAGSNDLDVWESTSADSATGNKIYQYVGSSNSSNIQFETYIEFSASKYVNFGSKSSTGTTVMGVETNA